MRTFAAPPIAAVLTSTRTDTLTLLVDADDVVARAFAIIDATPNVDEPRAAIARRFCTAMLQPLDGVGEQLTAVRTAAGELASLRLTDALAMFALDDDGSLSIAPPAFARGVPPLLAMTAQRVVPSAGSIRGWSWEADLVGAIAATDSVAVSIATAAHPITPPEAPPFVAACAALVFASADAGVRALIDAIAATTPELPPSERRHPGGRSAGFQPAPAGMPADRPAGNRRSEALVISDLDVLVTPGGQLVFTVTRNGALEIASAFQPVTWFAGPPVVAFIDSRVDAVPSVEALLAAILTPGGTPAFPSCEAVIHVEAVTRIDQLPVTVPLITAAIELPIPFTENEEVQALDRTVAAMMPDGATAAYDVTIACDAVPRLRVLADQLRP